MTVLIVVLVVLGVPAVLALWVIATALKRLVGVIDSLNTNYVRIESVRTPGITLKERQR